ncbi:MAG: hypothetical protein K0V04_14435, partial [Deltaproteobacteria bacterium]|nr:hypothetical protein [Deltaproteobacteria bacterium]
MSLRDRCAVCSWAWLALLCLWTGLGASVACHPAELTPQALDVPPVPQAPVVARLDPAGVPPWSQGPPLAEPLAPAVVDTGPHGEAPYYPQIFVRFNQGMTAPDEDAPALIRLEPSVPGTVRWPDSYQAVFSPTHALHPGQRYTVVAEGTIETLDGRPLHVSRRWTIDGERTTVTIEGLGDDGYRLYAADGEAPITHWKTRLLVEVDRKASLAALRGSLVVSGRPVAEPEATAKPLPFRVRRPTRAEAKRLNPWRDTPRHSFIVEPPDHWPADHRVGVRVESDFHAEDDALGLAQSIVAYVQTEPGVGVELRCDIEYDDGCDPGPVGLTFENPITNRQLAHVRVSPRPATLEIEGKDVYGDGITEVSIDGRFEPGQRYTISVGPKLRDVYGQPLREAFSQSVDFVTPPPSLRLSGSRGFLPADQPTTVGLESRSVVRARLRVAVLEDDATVARAGFPVDDGMFPSTGAAVVERELSLHPSGTFEWSSVVLDLATFTKGERRA